MTTGSGKSINCQYACPVNTPAMNYIEHIVGGDFDASLCLNFIGNLFPHILGRICTHPCETACRRGANRQNPLQYVRSKGAMQTLPSKKYSTKTCKQGKTGKTCRDNWFRTIWSAAANDLH